MAHAPEACVSPRATSPDSMFRTAAAGLLGWLVPGLGHIFIGDRLRGIICMSTIILTFWTGVAIGGVRGTVDPKERSLWFLAQLCTGSNAGAAYAVRQAEVNAEKTAPPDPWVSAEIGVHYTGVAGLLNILVILDAMARAEGGRVGGRTGDRGPPGRAEP